MTTDNKEYNKGFEDAWNKINEILLPMDVLTEEEFKQLKTFKSKTCAIAFIREKADFQKSKLYNSGIGTKEAHEYYEMYKNNEWKKNEAQK